MRALFIVLLLGACAQEPPQPRLAGEFSVEAPRAICSVNGEEALLYTLSDGTKLDPIPTGKACDYQAFRDYLDAYGEYPPAIWRGMEGYEHWRERHGRDA